MLFLLEIKGESLTMSFSNGMRNLNEQGCRMVEMSCSEHDKYAAGSQFITHTVGRLGGISLWFCICWTSTATIAHTSCIVLTCKCLLNQFPCKMLLSLLAFALYVTCVLVYVMRHVRLIQMHVCMKTPCKGH